LKLILLFSLYNLATTAWIQKLYTWSLQPLNSCRKCEIQWYRKRDANVTHQIFFGLSIQLVFTKVSGNYQRPLIQNILVNRFLETYRILLFERIYSRYVCLPKRRISWKRKIWGKSKGLDSLISTISLFSIPTWQCIPKLS
jgi:hypothetical protein